MLRTLLPAVATAIVLGASSLTAVPATAQPYPYGYNGSGPGYRFGPPPPPPPPRYGGYGRPYYGYGRPYYGPRCFYRPVRYWDGWGWVVRERRVCR
jgi:hypothetical protein